MGQRQSIDDEAPGAGEESQRSPSGSQTLFRGLDVLDAVAERPIGLAELAARLGLTRSTTHRLAAALVERHFLTFVPREGYSLGPKLLELGYQARQQMDIPRVARPHLQSLAALSEDTVHLGILDGDSALYLDKIAGQRRIAISSRVGERQPLTTTGLGKALLLDHDEAAWRSQFELEAGHRLDHEALEIWIQRMRHYAKAGYAFDLEENEDRIRCVAAPVRGADGAIIAAISVSSAAQYMDEARMNAMIADVQETARSISRDLGWKPPVEHQAAAASEPTALKRATK